MSKYKLHFTDYILKYFDRYLTEEESAGIRTVNFTFIDSSGEEELQTFIPSEDSETLSKLEPQVKGNSLKYREQVAERIYKEHQSEIDAAQCEKCLKLPMTPRATQCIWCGHSWSKT